MLSQTMTFSITRQAKMPAKNKIISQTNRKYNVKFRHKHVLLTVLSSNLTPQQRCCESLISSTSLEFFILLLRSKFCIKSDIIYERL